MLKIHYISDIHIDSYLLNMYHNKSTDDMKEYIDEVIKWFLHKNHKKADVLIIAGDIANYNHISIAFLEKISKYYKKVLFTYWNHDLYLINEEAITYDYNSFNKIKKIKSYFKNTNVSLLDGEIEEIEKDNKKYKILWIWMWYDFSYWIQNFPWTDNNLLKILWKQYINDSKCIYDTNKEIIDPLSHFNKEKEKLNIKLKEKPDIVFSHMWPITPSNMQDKFKKDKKTSFYYFDWKEILKNNKNIKYWVFGHTHDKYNFTFEKTKLLCNPLWYKIENINNKIKEINIK